MDITFTALFVFFIFICVRLYNYDPIALKCPQCLNNSLETVAFKATPKKAVKKRCKKVIKEEIAKEENSPQECNTCDQDVFLSKRCDSCDFDLCANCHRLEWWNRRQWQWKQIVPSVTYRIGRNGCLMTKNVCQTVLRNVKEDAHYRKDIYTYADGNPAIYIDFYWRSMSWAVKALMWGYHLYTVYLYHGGYQKIINWNVGAYTALGSVSPVVFAFQSLNSQTFQSVDEDLDSFAETVKKAVWDSEKNFPQCITPLGYGILHHLGIRVHYFYTVYVNCSTSYGEFWNYV